MKYYLILPYCDILPNIEDDSIVIGVDLGCKYALDNNIKLDYAVGDFDSIDLTTLASLEAMDVKKIILPKEKDDTDTEYTLKHFGIDNDYIIYGGIKGNRIEHFIANMRLVLKYNLTIIDKNSIIGKIMPNMTFDNSNYKYVSFYAKEGDVISLEGFKYNLDNYIFKHLDNLCISNELKSNPKVTFKGNGIYVLSRADS